MRDKNFHVDLIVTHKDKWTYTENISVICELYQLQFPILPNLRRMVLIPNPKGWWEQEPVLHKPAQRVPDCVKSMLPILQTKKVGYCC